MKRIARYSTRYKKEGGMVTVPPYVYACLCVLRGQAWLTPGMPGLISPPAW